MKKLCIKLVIYKEHTKMHGQQNIKYSGSLNLSWYSNPTNLLKVFLKFMVL